MNEIALMREIAKLQGQIDSLRTIEVGGVWKDWTPTFSAGGSMTFTSVTTNESRYCVVGNLLHYKIRANGTTGGTANPEIYFTAPINRADTTFVSSFASGLIYDTAEYPAVVTFNGSSQSLIRVTKFDSPNWGLGATKVFIISGFYEI